LQALLTPYTGGADAASPTLPLPQVVRMELTKGFDRNLFDPVVKARFPNAEVDDAQPVLAAVSHGVRLVEMVGLGLTLMMAVVMALLVTLTVRAGLRAHRGTLELLQHLGATQGLVMKLVSSQVLERALLGWALAGAGAVAVMLGGAFFWPVLSAYLGYDVWGALAFAPALLPLVAWVTARAVVRRLLNAKRGE
jgi:cell division protein FtsX